jgi:Transposase DDE domain
MACANLSVLEEFIETIKCVTSSKEIQSSFLSKEHCFTRSRKLGFDTVTFLILSLLKKSLNIELKTYFLKMNIVKESMFTKGAFSQRRHQIDSKWFKFLLEYLAYLYYELSKNISLWKGYKLVAIDGSSAILVKGEDIDNTYKGGQNKYGSYPLCRYMKMFDVLNEMTLKIEMLPMNGSERMCAYKWIDSIPSNSITLYDRGFPSFTLFYLMQSSEVPKDFIVRCKKDFSNSIKDFVASSEVSIKIKFYPDDRAVLLLKSYSHKVTKSTFIELRVEKIFLNTGEIEILITSIADEKLLSNADMKMLYNKRWSIETNIGKEKNLLQLENFSSHIKNGIEQDFFATFIANNIHSILSKEAQEKVNEKVKGRKYNYKINASASMHEFKHNLICIFYCKKLRSLIKHIQSIFELFIEPVRPNRNVGRKRICKRRYGKHQTHKNYRNNM